MVVFLNTLSLKNCNFRLLCHTLTQPFPALWGLMKQPHRLGALHRFRLDCHQAWRRLLLVWTYCRQDMRGVKLVEKHSTQRLKIATFKTERVTKVCSSSWLTQKVNRSVNFWSPGREQILILEENVYIRMTGPEKQTKQDVFATPSPWQTFVKNSFFKIPRKPLEHRKDV